jgi:regulatory protein
MEAAAMFLAVRPRSVDETRRRLLHLGYRQELVDTVIERLLGLRYLDDDEFARAWVESRDRARPRGEQALRRELSIKGIGRERIAAVLAERAVGGEPNADSGPGSDAGPGSPDRAAAERLLERRRSALMREVDPQKRRNRAYSLLARNGFDPDTCRSAVTAFEAQADDAAP